jgi:hypothetical protein
MKKRKSKDEYSPLARLPAGLQWGDIETLEEKMIEKDPYMDVARRLAELSASSAVSVEQLEGLTTFIATGELPHIDMPSVVPYSHSDAQNLDAALSPRLRVPLKLCLKSCTTRTREEPKKTWMKCLEEQSNCCSKR